MVSVQASAKLCCSTGAEKKTEIGVFPSDWDIVELGRIGEFKNGINKDSAAFGHGSPFVNLMDVFGVPSISSTEHLGLIASTPSEQNFYDLRAGDVLFVRSSVKPSGVALTTAVLSDLQQAVFSGFLIRFRDNGKLTTNFKRHCFSSEYFRRLAIAASSVSANTNISQSALKNLRLAVPATHVEQEAIAEALSSADALIFSLEALIAKKRAIKQGVMHDLLSGKRRLPGFKGEWVRAPLLSAVSLPVGQVDPKCSPYSSMLLIGPEHIEEATGRLKLPPTAAEQGAISGKYQFSKGDVIYGKINPHLRKVVLAPFDGICSADLYPLRPNPNVSGAFVAAALLSEEFTRYAVSLSARSGIPKINRTELAGFSLWMPSNPDEQRAIAAAFVDMDQELLMLDVKLTKARQLKQGMMQDLLTGRVRLV